MESLLLWLTKPWELVLLSVAGTHANGWKRESFTCWQNVPEYCKLPLISLYPHLPVNKEKIPPVIGRGGGGGGGGGGGVIPPPPPPPVPSPPLKALLTPYEVV